MKSGLILRYLGKKLGSDKFFHGNLSFIFNLRTKNFIMINLERNGWTMAKLLNFLTDFYLLTALL